MLLGVFVFLSFFLAFLFFGLIPGLGAFWVRAKWRRFRSRMLEASTFAFIDYSDLRQEKEGTSFRFFGNLEAIQGGNRVWIRVGRSGSKIA